MLVDEGDVEKQTDAETSSHIICTDFQLSRKSITKRVTCVPHQWRGKYFEQGGGG